MAFMAAAGGVQHRARLVRAHHAHQGGFAHDGQCGLDVGVLQVFEKAQHAVAAHFFVVRQREMDRALQLGLGDVGRERQRHTDEAFHVAGAAAV